MDKETWRRVEGITSPDGDSELWLRTLEEWEGQSGHAAREARAVGDKMRRSPRVKSLTQHLTAQSEESDVGEQFGNT